MHKVDFKYHTFRSTEIIFFHHKMAVKRYVRTYVLSSYIFTQTYIRLMLLNVKQNHGHHPLLSIFYIYELHIINI